MGFSDLVPKDAILECVYTGCAFAEGTAADTEGNVYFSDFPNNRIMLYRTDGTTVVWKEPSFRANGMNFDIELDGSLTSREIEVLGMLAEGLANKNIAWRLGISEHTVKFHITSIFTKLNASSRAEAVAIGMRRGLILL